MALSKLFKLLKKNRTSIFFLSTLIYFLYTYVSIFLYFFNNAVFYLIINISIMYFGFHFIVRALTYPGSLYIYCKKVEFDNRIELCKHYLQEVMIFSFSINGMRENVEELLAKNNPGTKSEHDNNEKIKIKSKDLFNSDKEDICFKFFSSLHIFYNLYVCYYLYVNLEKNINLPEEHLAFYFYLKRIMQKINEIKIHIEQKRDIVETEIFTEVKIGSDLNPKVVQKLNVLKEVWESFCNQNIRGEIERHKKDGIDNFLFSKTNAKEMKDFSFSNARSKEENNAEELKTNHNSTGNEFNYVKINMLNLLHHKNYSGSITSTFFNDFYIDIDIKLLLKHLKEIIILLLKLGEILEKNTHAEKFYIGNMFNFFRDLFRKSVIGSLDLFKYELIYKYYAKQDYLHINNTQLDCMFIPCQNFIQDKLEKYLQQKKEKKDKYQEKQEKKEKQPNDENAIFFSAFNNEFYNFLYDKDFLNDIPVLLYFNPNGSYYEQNACSLNTIKFYLEKQINVFVYNYRGYSKSKGLPSLHRNNEDALYLATYLLSKNVKFLGLHGRSIGGPLCFYVSYNINNIDKQEKDMKWFDNIEKNEICMAKVIKKITKMKKILGRNKKKFLNKHIFLASRVFILLLQIIHLVKLKIICFGLKLLKKYKWKQTKHNLYNGRSENYNKDAKKNKIAFICVDRSFSNFGITAKYMIGEYAYHILNYTSYKLDITNYYINTNVPKIVIYDNNDEIIHYLSNVITGVSNEIHKLYKNGKLLQKDIRTRFSISNTGMNKINYDTQFANDNFDKIKQLNDKYKEEELIPLINSEQAKGIDGKIKNVTAQFDKEAKRNFSDHDKLITEKRPINILDENCCHTDVIVIDDYVVKPWIRNRLKNIDIQLFLESWEILNDYCSFINKNDTQNNMFISIALDCYNTIIDLFNSEVKDLEKEANNALYCIYNKEEHFNLLKTFTAGSSNCQKIFDERTRDEKNENGEKIEKNIFDMVNENKNYKREINKLNKILKDLYVSKRKEIEKVHFTYNGFFLRNDFLYDYIQTDEKNGNNLTFNIERADVFHFVNEFSYSINEILDAINNQLNSGGQIFHEIQKVKKKDKVNFIKSFIRRMKVFGSFPPQCFNTSRDDEFSNFLYHIPFILSNYCEKESTDDIEIEIKGNDKDKHKNNEENSNNSFDACNDADSDNNNNSDYEELEKVDDIIKHSNSKLEALKKNEPKQHKKKKRVTIKESFEKNKNFYNGNNLLKPYVTVEKSLLLHDIIICLDLHKEKEKDESPNIFYKLDDNVYLIDLKELLFFFKKKKFISLKSNRFIDIFAYDIGTDVTNNYENLSKELEKYVSWLRLNSVMTVNKISLLIENEINRIRNYSKIIIKEYASINQNSSVQSIIFLIYRIELFKKILTHVYVIYSFFYRLNKSVDLDFIENDLIELADINPLTLIKSFHIFYTSHYQIYMPRSLGYPLLVTSGHNGNLSKSEENIFNLYVNSFLK